MRIKIVSIPVTMEVPELDKYEIEEIRTALSQTKERRILMGFYGKRMAGIRNY